MADPRGRTRRTPPLRVPILSFWHTNFTKHSCVGSWRSPYEVGAPLREILDPPLQSKYCRKSMCRHLDQIHKCTKGFQQKHTWKYKNELYKHSKICIMDISDHDLYWMCTNHNEMHKSEVDSHPWISIMRKVLAGLLAVGSVYLVVSCDFVRPTLVLVLVLVLVWSPMDNHSTS